VVVLVKKGYLTGIFNYQLPKDLNIFIQRKLMITMFTNRLFLVLIAVFFINACSGSDSARKKDDIVVGKVAGEYIYLSDLKLQFYKSGVRAPGDLSAEDEARELVDFLPLYIDYRAKLASAKTGGYFQDNGILDELNDYERQTAYPYWLENKVRESLLQELIERSETELEASHILIALPNNPSPTDTLRAYNRLIEARNKALAGADFDSLSNVYSSVQQGRSMGGYLGYFSAGWAVKEFEDVAYNTAVGQLSMPFRTQFGFHVIQVKNERKTSPDRYIAHIFLRVPDESATDFVMERAREIYANIINDVESWTQSVGNYSEDYQSAPMDGIIGWVNHGRYDPRFTDVVMNIESIGNITEPFFSGYGVHIVRMDSIRTFTNDTDFRNEMLSRLRGLPRYRDNRKITTSNVRETAGESINEANLARMEEVIYANRGAGFANAAFTSEILSSPVYRIAGKWYNASDYLSWIYTQIDTSTTNNYHFTLRDRYFDHIADQNIVEVTKQVFPAFEQLSREYHNGLVIFKISEDSVWNYSRMDTTRLQQIFDADPSRYQFDQRYFYYRFAAVADSTLDQVRQSVLAGTPIDSLRNSFPGLLIRADVINTLSEFPYDFLDGLNPGEFSDYFDFRNRRTTLMLDRVEESRNMTFDEAFFRVVSDYQPVRELEWVNTLRRRFNVEMYPDRIPGQAPTQL